MILCITLHLSDIIQGPWTLEGMDLLYLKTVLQLWRYFRGVLLLTPHVSHSLGHTMYFHQLQGYRVMYSLA